MQDYILRVVSKFVDEIFWHSPKAYAKIYPKHDTAFLKDSILF